MNEEFEKWKLNRIYTEDEIYEAGHKAGMMEAAEIGYNEPQRIESNDFHRGVEAYRKAIVSTIRKAAEERNE